MRFESSFNVRYVIGISFVTALGGLLFGFDLSNVSGTIIFFSNYFELSPFQTGWAVGCINLGAVIGALFSGRLADKYGRKKILLFCALLFAITGIGTGWALNFEIFILFRILSGIAVGTAALVCPMYIAEIAPASVRGRMVSFYQLAITFGILLAYFSNYLLLGTGADNWRWMFSAQSLPAVLFCFCVFLIPESPKWLIGKVMQQKAKEILKRIGGEHYAEKEMESVIFSFKTNKKEPLSELLSKELRPILLLGVTIAAFSQLVGQNTIFSYAPEIFKKSGVSQDSAFIQSMVLGTINLLFTFVSIFSIDKLGRKLLLSLGSVLLFIMALCIAGTFIFTMPAILTLVFVLLFIAIYSATIGPATWVTISEIFPNRIRGYGMSIATLSLWFSNFLSITTFPSLESTIGLPATYILYGVVSFAYFIIIRKTIPETKGKSLEDIEKLILKTEN